MGQPRGRRAGNRGAQPVRAAQMTNASQPGPELPIPRPPQVPEAPPPIREPSQPIPQEVPAPSMPDRGPVQPEAR